MPSRMTIILVAGVTALTLLTGCSSSPRPKPTPSATAAPYLSADDDGTHKIPASRLKKLNLNDTSVRYQGAWQGRSVFLAKSTVDPLNTCIVVGLEGGTEPWLSECGRDAFAIALSTYGTFRYNANGFLHGTNGYTALTKWLLAANGTAPA